MSRFLIENGFPNFNGIGPYLTGKLLEGNIKVGDKLVINQNVEIPIIEVQKFILENSSNSYRLTIPREFDNSDEKGFKLFELYGRVLNLSQ